MGDTVLKGDINNATTSFINIDIMQYYENLLKKTYF